MGAVNPLKGPLYVLSTSSDICKFNPNYVSRYLPMNMPYCPLEDSST